MSSEALDEEGHGDDKAYAHEEDAIPIGLRNNHARGVSKPISLFVPKMGCIRKIFIPSI